MSPDDFFVSLELTDRNANPLEYGVRSWGNNPVLNVPERISSAIKSKW